MFKIGTITTITDSYFILSVSRNLDLKFSTIEVVLKRDKGDFIYPIHFDYLIKEGDNIDNLVFIHLEELKYN
tara:strand:- start:3722 stop:3937 length:216 start_codon:yes stop_codon:yes gene_type:complete